MKLGIVGLPGAGRKTVFEALTRLSVGHMAESQLGTVKVPDKRVDALSEMYHPKKTIYAQVEYLLPAAVFGAKEKEQHLWTQVRDCDALIHVVRNFTPPGLPSPRPAEDFREVDQELMVSDLVVIERRLERLELDSKRGKKPDPEELDLLQRCRSLLEADQPLRRDPALASAPLLRGFAFLSAKPMLVLFNNGDEDDEIPPVVGISEKETCAVIKGRLEQELVQMSPEEVEAFLEEFHITASAMDRIIELSYHLLGRISFFTVGEDEVRAWTVGSGTPAVEAAGAIHTDLQKGFIRAEVVSYADLMEAGSVKEARNRATFRLEGKSYEVKDGDILTIRFNV